MIANPRNRLCALVLCRAHRERRRFGRSLISGPLHPRARRTTGFRRSVAKASTRWSASTVRKQGCSTAPGSSRLVHRENEVIEARRSLNNVCRPTASRVFTTAVTYGVVNVSNLDIQLEDAFHRTRSGRPSTWCGIRFRSWTSSSSTLAGTRVNKHRQRATSSQIQSGWTLKF